MPNLQIPALLFFVTPHARAPVSNVLPHVVQFANSVYFNETTRAPFHVISYVLQHCHKAVSL